MAFVQRRYRYSICTRRHSTSSVIREIQIKTRRCHVNPLAWLLLKKSKCPNLFGSVAGARSVRGCLCRRPGIENHSVEPASKLLPSPPQPRSPADTDPVITLCSWADRGPVAGAEEQRQHLGLWRRAWTPERHCPLHSPQIPTPAGQLHFNITL